MSGGERTLSYLDGTGAGEDEFAAPYLVLALECERPLAAPLRLSIAEVDQVVIGRAAERGYQRRADDGVATLSIGLADGWMSSRHARLHKSGSAWTVRDEGSKNGTFVAGRRVDEALLRDGDVIEAGSSVLLYRDQVHRSFREPPDVDGATARPVHPALATLSIPLARAFARLAQVAASSVPVVLCGESGTGKEVLARALHELSGRGRFVALNCGALPEALVEGELFGHRKGAFSGATDDRPGLVRAADRGTLFLDEIADLPLASQVKLLRVLQEGEVTPLGATRPVAVDLRVVCASHRGLADEVAAGRFRADLYARLAGHEVALPPLRERREDLGALIGALLRRHAGERAGELRLERDAARSLFHHDWPLNVRELEQALRAALALAADGRIQASHLPPAIAQAAAPAPAGGGEADQALRDELGRLLALHRGNVSQVARDLGKARVQIRRWCRRFGIDPERFRG